MPTDRRSIKLIIIIFLSVRIIQNAVCEDWSVSLTPLFSTEYGAIGEYVYGKDSSGSDAKISELSWDIKPALHYGGKAGVSWKAISLFGFARGAVPMRSGGMGDSDWNEYGVKIIYSAHENTLASSYSFGGHIEYTFTISDAFVIRPFIGADYTYISLQARKGHAWDGRDAGVSWDHPLAAQYNTMGIDYTREEVYTYTGATFGIIINKFRASFSAAFSPYTYMQSLDRHYGRGYYIDIMHGPFSAYRFEAEASYVFNKNISLSLALSWTLTGIIKGDTYNADRLSGPWYKFDGIRGGASRNTARISIGCTYRFTF